jgi:hypothetical protein
MTIFEKIFTVQKLLIAYILLLTLFFGSCGQINNNATEPINRHEAHLIYTHHAHCRMDCRHITEVEIKEILEKGEINYNKSEPNGHPDPKYALDGYTKEGQHLRVVFATAERGLVVITCIELGVEWQCDCN